METRYLALEDAIWQRDLPPMEVAATLDLSTEDFLEKMAGRMSFTKKERELLSIWFREPEDLLFFTTQEMFEDLNKVQEVPEPDTEPGTEPDRLAVRNEMLSMKQCVASILGLSLDHFIRKENSAVWEGKDLVAMNSLMLLLCQLSSCYGKAADRLLFDLSRDLYREVRKCR